MPAPSRPRLRRLRNFSPPIIASGAASRNRLTTAAPGGVSSDGALHEPPPEFAAGAGSCVAIAVGPRRFVDSTGGGVDVGTKVDVGVGTRVGVGGSVAVGIGAGVCGSGGGGVASPLTVSVKLPVCAPP